MAVVPTSAKLPTRFGKFTVYAFNDLSDKGEHVALVKGDIGGQEQVLTRVHSECLTGDAFGSLRCDCRDQLTMSLDLIERNGSGVVLYLRQEGRGIGLYNKLKAYALQDQGLDTFAADRQLGFTGDERQYDVVAQMLESLQVRSIKLLTNNPHKLAALSASGITIIERLPLIAPTTPENADYIRAKVQQAGHLYSV
jgi:3,4-dihydroxy 2-butanone 4-phosphate synthase / GTP cyclohydrolase II